MKVVFATPSLAGPTKPYIKALEDSIPLITGAGWEEGYAQEVRNAYISGARASLCHRALKAGADVVFYLDYDLSWKPEDLLKVLNTPGDVVAGTYRFKQFGVEDYMGSVFTDEAGRPICRRDGCIKASRVPAGFLKITKEAVARFAAAYPHLVFGHPDDRQVDLFNHGAHGGLWYGEDYAFSRNWIDLGGEIWLVPDLDIDHHEPARVLEDGTRTEGHAFPGNYHKFLLAYSQAEALKEKHHGFERHGKFEAKAA